MDRSASRLFAPSLTRLESRDSQSSLSATSPWPEVSLLIPTAIASQSVTCGHATTSPASSTAGLGGHVAIDPIIIVALPPNVNPPQPSTPPTSESAHALGGVLEAVPVAAPAVATMGAGSQATHPAAENAVYFPPPQPHAPVRVPVG